MAYKKREFGDEKAIVDSTFSHLDLPHVSHNIFKPQYEFGKFYFKKDHELVADFKYDKIDVDYDPALKEIRNRLKGEFPIHYINTHPVDMPLSPSPRITFEAGVEEVIDKFARQYEQEMEEAKAELRVAITVARKTIINPKVKRD